MLLSIVNLSERDWAVIYEPQSQWFDPWQHVEVSLDKTSKPRSSTDIYCLATVQQQFPPRGLIKYVIIIIIQLTSFIIECVTDIQS